MVSCNLITQLTSGPAAAFVLSLTELLEHYLTNDLCGRESIDLCGWESRGDDCLTLTSWMWVMWSITTKQKLLLLVFLPNSCKRISCRIFWPTETLLILFSIYNEVVNMYIKDKHLNILTSSIFTLRTSPHIRLVAQVVCEVVTLRVPIRWRQINLYVLYIITFQIHVRYLKSDHTCPVCLTQV